MNVQIEYRIEAMNWLYILLVYSTANNKTEKQKWKISDYLK